MGYSYTMEELARIQRTNAKDSELLEKYKNGFTFNEHYIFLVSDNKFPKWNVTMTKFWLEDKFKSIEFSSFKKAVEYTEHPIYAPAIFEYP